MLPRYSPILVKCLSKNEDALKFVALTCPFRLPEVSKQNTSGLVSYRLLADPALRTRSVPLFVTLGSPLGIGMMRSILPPRQTIPDPPIGRWVNGYRRDDFVALDRPLDTTTIGLSGVENITDGLTEESDKHSVLAYLKSPKICARIHDALG